MLLSDILRRNAKLFPGKTAIAFENGQISYASLNQRVNRLAHALLGQFLGLGDRVAILMTNRPEYLECYFAGSKTGITMVPINYRLSEQEVSYILSDAMPRGIIFEESYAELVGEFMRSHPHLEFGICVGKTVPGWAMDYEESLRSACDSEPEARVSPKDLIYIMYTSGTTGRPKGAMITHRNLLANSFTHCIETNLRNNDTFLTAAPLCLTGGINKTIGSMLMGVTVHVEPRFELSRFLKRLVEFGISHTFLVPAMIIFMLELPEIRSFDFSRLKMIMYGSAPMPLARLREALDLFQCSFIQTFGQTESSPVLTVLRPEDHKTEGPQSKRLLSAGREATGVEVRIFDENDLEVPPGVIGEVVARGDNIMKGYWNLPKETEETLRGGWLHTGDLGRADEESYIYIVDRKKDMIISGGMNIYSREVEEVLSSHPAVMESSVIGVPDDRWGESVKAFVVLRKDMTCTESEIVSFCQDKLGRYKQPRSLVFVESLPKNTSGKVLKEELRGPFWKDRERKVN